MEFSFAIGERTGNESDWTVSVAAYRAGGSGPVAPVLAGPLFSYKNNHYSLSFTVCRQPVRLIKNRRGE